VDEVTEEWRKLHNEELRNFYSSPNIIRQIKSRKMRWVGHVTRGKQMYEVLVEKPKGKRPLGRPKCRCENEIRMHLRETGWGCVEWIHLDQDRGRWRALVNT
jgi:hypothetical protein